jgi:hypothetical protein
MDPDEDNDSVLEGGSVIGTPKRSKVFDDTEEQMDQAGGDRLWGDAFAPMTGKRMDLDLLNKETGLKYRQYRFLSITLMGLTSLI